MKPTFQTRWTLFVVVLLLSCQGNSPNPDAAHFGGSPGLSGAVGSGGGGMAGAGGALDGARSSLCDLNGASHAVGDSFFSPDGCTHYSCTASGLLADKNGVPLSCGQDCYCTGPYIQYGHHLSGESWPADDGCNTCRCQSSACGCTTKICTGGDSSSTLDGSADASDQALSPTTQVDGGACLWPASFTSIVDDNAIGCWAHAILPSMDASQTSCSSSEYALHCVGESPVLDGGLTPHQVIPSPESSVGCRLLPLPTPQNQSYYCCPCGG